MSVSGATTFATITTTGNVSVGGTLHATGNTTTNGTLSIGHATAANAKLLLNNKVAIKGTDAWLRINEDKAFTSGIYFGNGIVRTDGTFQVGNNGSAVSVTTSAATIIVPATFSGGINTPKATITNLMVTDTLRSFKWDIEHVANLGGTFLVTPTYIATANSATVAVTVPSSGNLITAIITDSAISSSTLGGVAWNDDSKIKISGKLGGVAIGTCDGMLTAPMNGSNHTLSLQFTYPGQTNFPLTSKTYSASEVSDLTVMLTTVGATNPIGIYMTARDSNNYSHISLYGGTSTDPTVRIGNLSGLPAINGTDAPTGWGIYTQHGYFSGMVVSQSGKIGNWYIGTDAIYSSSKNFATANNMYFGTSGISLGTTFNVTAAGALTATSGTIGGWTIGTSDIHSGTHNAWDHASDGLFLGNTRIAGGNSGTWYLDQAGTGKIGRWTFASDGDFTTTVNNNTAGMGNASYAFWAGAASSSATSAPFRVGYDGTFVATSATITGTIHATGGEFGNPYGTHMTFDDNSIEIQSRTRVFAKFSENELVLTRKQPDGKAIITPDGYYLRDENDDSLYRNQLLFTNTTSCLIAEYDTSLNKYVVQLPIPYLILRSIKVKELDSSSETTYTDCSSYYVSDYLRVISPSQRPGIQLTVKYLPEFGYICSKIGINNLGTGANSFTLGRGNIMESAFSIACGDGNEVRGDSSAAFGDGNIVKGYSSFVCGTNNYAMMPYQTVIGKYNVLDTRNQNVFIVGNGANDSNRTNAFEVSWSGNVTAAGTLVVSEDISAGGSIVASGSVTGTSFVGNASTATKLSAAQKVYVTLGTASTTTTIQGGSSSAQTIGVNGTLGIGNGGTGKTSWTQYGLVYASATNALSQVGLGISGQLLMAKGSDAPEWVYQNDINSGKTGNGGIYLYANNSNEINFGGTNTSTTIYIGYRATDSRAIPTSFIFGGSGGSASITANNITAKGNLSATGNISASNFFPVNSIYVTSTNTNPNTILGFGTWTLFDKHYAPTMITDAFTLNSTNVSTLSGAWVKIAEHNILIRIQFNNKVTYADSTIDVGTFNLAKIGLASGKMPWYIGSGYCDNGNAIIMPNIDGSGKVQIQDVVANGTATQIAAGCSLQILITVTVHTIADMLDSFCDKFFWKRTA